MGKPGILGIDFGTSFSTLYAWDDELKQGIPIEERGRESDDANRTKIPSVAFWDEKRQDFVFGTTAKFNPDEYETDEVEDVDEENGFAEKRRQDILGRFIAGLKRMVGKKGAIYHFPQEAPVKHYTVEDVLTGFFRYFKETAEVQHFNAKGQTIVRVCVTHPVEFSPEQVDILADCAKKAGFPEVETLEEPVAAAMAFASTYADKKVPQFLVYDLGGGTFDTAYVVKDDDGSWRVPAIDGDWHCGGDDFDRAIYGLFQERMCEKKKRPDFRFSEDTSSCDLQVLETCRKIKEKLSLSGKEEASGSAYFRTGGHLESAKIKLSRADFEALVGDRIQHTVELTKRLAKQVKEAAGYVPDGVILIGGSSVIPMIKGRLEGELGLPTYRGQGGDVAVAHGAVLRLLAPRVVKVNMPERPASIAARRSSTSPSKWRNARKGIACGTCPNCKAPFFKGDRFCHACGKIFGELPSAALEGVRDQIERRLAVVAERNRTYELSPAYAWDKTVERYAGIVGKLRQLLVSPEMGCSGYLEEGLLDNLDAFLSKCADPEFHIAVVGTIKAGKSTLLNAMLGGEYASVSVTPETAVLTKFRASDTGKNRIEVVYYTSEEWKRIWDEVQRKQKTSPRDVATFLEKYEELGAESVKAQYLDRPPEAFECKSDADLKEKVKEWTSSTSPVHFFVKEVTLRLASLSLPSRVILVDTPGLDDVLEYRANITKRYLRRANAVLICVVIEGGMTGSALKDVIFTAFDCVRGSHKIYLLGTKTDALSKNPMKKWQEVQAEWIKYLTGKQGAEGVAGEYSATYASKEEAMTHIIGVAAELALDLQQIGHSEKVRMHLIHFAQEHLFYRPECDKDDAKLKEQIREFANTDLLWKRLDTDVISRHETLLLRDFETDYRLCAAQVRKFVKAVSGSCEDRIGAANRSAEAVREELDDLRARMQEAEVAIRQCAAAKEEADREARKAIAQLLQGV